MLSVLSRRMSGMSGMSGGPAGRPPSMVENALNERIGLVTPERLIAAAKSKQQQYVMTDPSASEFDLSNPENAQLLIDVSRHVLRHSGSGESIEKMADKVVVMCICLHEDPGLNKKNLIIAVNNVFMGWGRPDYHISRAVQQTMTRLKALSRSRGGFHKKTKCRRNKMRKSRKSRSRR